MTSPRVGSPRVGISASCPVTDKNAREATAEAICGRQMNSVYAAMQFTCIGLVAVARRVICPITAATAAATAAFVTGQTAELSVLGLLATLAIFRGFGWLNFQ